ncbi:unnamed protein product [marine sediment metagenome]|uniref:L-rhamnose mutarotase n=1 Tax=marine sediment metagenome TaxID=412755 RepID=X1L9U0_9ZZZZ
MKSYINNHKEIHKSSYKELLEVIKKSGVKEEVIFIYKNLAIIYFEADDIDICYEFRGKFEVVKKWNKLMAPLFISVYEFTTIFNPFFSTLLYYPESGYIFNK